MRNLEKYVICCMAELDAIGINYGNILEVKVNMRAKTRLGRCRKTSKGYLIEINSNLLDESIKELYLKNTIIHELLHTCEGCMNHGTNWKRLADKVNRVYGYNISRVGSLPKEKDVKEIIKPNYIIKCSKCGKTYSRIKKSKLVQHPEHYRCGRCGGKLNLIFNKFKSE